MPLLPPLTLPALSSETILIFDVDGVIREGTETPADPRVVVKIKKLLQDPRIHIIFLSGTPISNNPDLEVWRRGNQPLTYVFGKSFEKEIAEGRVSIYGMLGNHLMQKDGSFTVIESFSLETTFQLGKVLLKTFIEEIEQAGSLAQKACCVKLKKMLEDLNLSDLTQKEDETATEFGPIASLIRKEIDPEFRLINSGGVIETQVFLKEYNATRCLERVKQLICQLNLKETPYCATGVAKRGDHPFHFLLLSKTHKGHTARKLIAENKKLFPNAFIITVGDTQIDFPMHEKAHLAFHVGLESVWRAHPLPHCHLVLGEQGEDDQHIEGTLQVIDVLQASAL